MACRESNPATTIPIDRPVPAVRPAPAVWTAAVGWAATRVRVALGAAVGLAALGAAPGCGAASPGGAPRLGPPIPVDGSADRPAVGPSLADQRGAAGVGPSTAASEPAKVDPPAWVAAVAAACAPPAGWRADPLDRRGSGGVSQVWVSPSGATAYGVIAVRHLLMPLASDRQILGEFLREMKASEGAADLLDQRPDPGLAGGIGGLRFVARGGRYTVRATLVSSGTRAWVVFAGTLVAQPVQPDELRLAEAARERTVVEPARDKPH